MVLGWCQNVTKLFVLKVYVDQDYKEIVQTTYQKSLEKVDRYGFLQNK